jgi:hypothetical protein
VTCDEALAAVALGKGNTAGVAVPAGAVALGAGAAVPAGAVALGAGAAVPAGAVAHLAGCAACRDARAQAGAVARALAGYAAPAPAPGAEARTLAAAMPLLARRREARRALRRRVTWALTMALLPLPAIVLVNVQLLMAAHRLALTRLPPALALYLVVCLGAGVALLLALSYVAVPLLAARRPPPFVLEDRDVHVPA